MAYRIAVYVEQDGEFPAEPFCYSLYDSYAEAESHIDEYEEDSFTGGVAVYIERQCDKHGWVYAMAGEDKCSACAQEAWEYDFDESEEPDPWSDYGSKTLDLVNSRFYPGLWASIHENGELGITALCLMLIAEEHTLPLEEVLAYTKADTPPNLPDPREMLPY